MGGNYVLREISADTLTDVPDTLTGVSDTLADAFDTLSSGRVFLGNTISHRELEPFLQELG